jgi:D-alanyl-D-alanine carboxypeptidase
MRVRRQFLPVVSSLLLLTVFAAAEVLSRGSAISQADLEAIVYEQTMFSGTVVVAQDGEILASSHVGFANQETDTLNNSRTLHSVASVGKMFTAVALVQLVEKDKLAYDMPVLQIIPELGDQVAPTVTIDHLLHHTSGLGRMSDVSDATLDALESNADHFELILSTGVASDGPTEFSYRNTNFHVLGEIIERVSGQSYESYVREFIADPVGMTGPFFTRRDRALTLPIAEHYMAVDFETWWNSEESIVAGSADEFIHIAPPATPSAGGGSYATGLDMMRFAKALRDGSLISIEGFKTMCSLTPAAKALHRGYGRGCSINIGEGGTRVGHTGSSAGIQARFFLYLELGVDVVVLSNHDEQAAPIFVNLDKLIRSDDH